MTGVPMVVMSDDEIAAYGRSDGGGFGALETARGRLPLIALEVDARVVGVIAAIDVAQTFVNTTGVAIEATYIFPLPDRAAVQRFRLEVGGRVIEGVIDERGAARASYDRAIAAGQRAAIAEEERSGVFTLRVGNLMPGDTAIARLSLIGPLPVDDGEVTFRFPLVVAPRYIPGAPLGGDAAGLGRALDTDLVPDASRISPPVLLPGCPNPVRLGLRVAIADGVMRDVASSLHAVTQRTHDAQIIEVQPGERLDRDFVLRWRIDVAALHSSLVCADDTHGGGAFALMIVPPSTAQVAARPRDVVFVLDRSGSMGGWKMVAARRAVARMIDTLTSRDRFCALAFDDEIEAVPAVGLVAATDRQRFRAIEALARIESRGGTELAAPLSRAIAALDGGTADRERTIVLVTDGQVGNEDDILRRLAPELRSIKMFALGIDQAVNAGFLRRLAAAGGGLCELVESEDRLDQVMAKVHRRIGTPIATELALQATGLEIDRATLAPGKLPDVYAGAPVVVFGRYRGRAAAQAAISVEGTSLGEPLRMTVPVTQPPDAAGWLAASWARAHLRDLEDRYAAGAHELELQIVAVSRQYGVLSRFTAFIAVDHSVVNPGGGQRQIVQPVEQPGWAERDLAVLAGPPAATSLAHGDRGLAVLACSPAATSLAKVAAHAAPRAGSPPSAPVAVPPAAHQPLAPYGTILCEDAGDTEGAVVDMEIVAAVERGADDDTAPEGAAPASRMGGLAVEGTARRSRALPRVAVPSSVASLPLPPVGADGSPAVYAAYLSRLAALAVELAEQARGRCEPSVIRLVRQRLVQWTEDLRSVGGHGHIASAVEALVQRLSTALAESTSLASEASAVAEALTRLAVGEPPSGAPRTGGRAFWK